MLFGFPPDRASSFLGILTESPDRALADKLPVEVNLPGDCAKAV
jgi:hypothetical protein